ncbi:hypothetical protein PCE1_001442 [Barthelona sp. PCE]
MWFYVALFAALFPIVSYVFPILLSKTRAVTNLNQRYGKCWALVTGGSSGIGRAIVRKVASQGINIVIVARDQMKMDLIAQEIRIKYDVEVKTISADLSTGEGSFSPADKVLSLTEDLDIRMVFLNAGYMTVTPINTSLVNDTDTDAVLNRAKKMKRCLVDANIDLSHRLFERIRNQDRKGAIVFISSAASYFPFPVYSHYAASKAYVRLMALSLAIEAKGTGIDVLSIQPGPVKTAFFDDLPSTFWLRMAIRIFGSTPDKIAHIALQCLGRVHSRDVGTFTISSRILDRFFPIERWLKTFGLAFSMFAPSKKKEQKKEKAAEESDEISETKELTQLQEDIVEEGDIEFPEGYFME